MATRLLPVIALLTCAVGCEKQASAPSARGRADAAVAARNAPPPAVDAGVAPPPAPEPPRCEDAKGVVLFASPASPRAGVPLRVLAVSDEPLTAELRVSSASTADASVAPAAASDERRGGPPYFWIAEVPSPRAGAWTAKLAQSACAPGEEEATLRVRVKKGRPAPPPVSSARIWRTRRRWSRAWENVYSAWIEALFDAPVSEQPSWKALHEVLRDPKRNLLYDYLGAGEDSANAPVVRPDCADLPYFLRAYFAFKVGLPFGVGTCDRGGAGEPPSCEGLITNEDPPVHPGDTAVETFGKFLRGTLADHAHSGSARAPFDDPDADYYAVTLTWDSLRPGTIYADPYGHVLMVARKIPQSGERGGALLAVDGQPDGTVARKRFWRGNFLYANDRALGGPGFKRFRPIARRDGHLARLTDAEIAALPGYGDVARAPGALGVEAFYDRMDDVLSPRPLDPKRAMLETIDALDEQVRTRVRSVENGRQWLAKATEPAPMPEGAEIFETTGPWEDFATPSRDLRLLIAIDVVARFPARVARRPTRYAVEPGTPPKQIEAALAALLARELASRKITYTRTDGSPFTLTLAEVIARSEALEMAYDLNDCVETRWGAPPGSDEASTCRAHAPSEQRARMESYRPWFAERRRPARK